MAKITSYKYITDIQNGTVFLTDGPDGTAQLQGLDAPYAIAGREADKAAAHRSIFRGKYLGTNFTAEQQAAIADGSFDDIWVGDYWTIDGINYRVADLDYFPIGTDTACVDGHHAVIIPDRPVGMGGMGGHNTYATSGGTALAFAAPTHVYSMLTVEGESNYGAAPDGTKKFLRSYLGGVLNMDCVKVRSSYQVTAITDGYPSARAYKSSYFDIPNEIMVCGHHLYAPAATGTVTPSRYTTEPRQLALFKIAPDYIKSSGSTLITHYNGSTYVNEYWLKDISGSAYALVNTFGRITTKATTSGGSGIRPFFCIG